MVANIKRISAKAYGTQLVEHVYHDNFVLNLCSKGEVYIALVPTRSFARERATLTFCQARLLNRIEVPGSGGAIKSQSSVCVRISTMKSVVVYAYS